MEQQAKENILQAIESEGLDYALREYADIFKDANDEKLNKMVDDYNKLFKQIEDYLGLDY